MSGREGKREASPKDSKEPHTHTTCTTKSSPKGVQKVARRGELKTLQTSDVPVLPEGSRTPNVQTRTQLTLLGPPHIHGEAEQRHETKVDTEAGMLSGVSRKRSIRSSPCWFTEFCKSQCLSHFAAPFIVV